MMHLAFLVLTTIQGAQGKQRFRPGQTVYVAQKSRPDRDNAFEYVHREGETVRQPIGYGGKQDKWVVRFGHETKRVPESELLNEVDMNSVNDILNLDRPGTVIFDVRGKSDISGEQVEHNQKGYLCNKGEEIILAWVTRTKGCQVPFKDITKADWKKIKVPEHNSTYVKRMITLIRDNPKAECSLCNLNFPSLMAKGYTPMQLENHNPSCKSGWFCNNDWKGEKKAGQLRHTLALALWGLCIEKKKESKKEVTWPDIKAIVEELRRLVPRVPPPSFNTLWQSIKCAGYPRKTTSLLRDPVSQRAYTHKHLTVEAGYTTEDYLRNKWLGGKTEPQIKQSAFPYNIMVPEGEKLEQLVLWLPHPDWSFVETVEPNNPHVRIKEEYIPKIRRMVETIIGEPFADEDILMYVHYKNKNALPNLPNVQVCIRRKPPARTCMLEEKLDEGREEKLDEGHLSGNIFNQQGYNRVIQTALAHSPLEYQIVENETHFAHGKKNLKNPFIPADAIEKATRTQPKYNENVRKFLQKHERKIRNFKELKYGKDFVYALHGTKKKVWKLIQDKGIRPSIDGQCGPGIYCTKSMGLCSNSSRGNGNTLGEPQFTTIWYASNNCKSDITCAIVVLVMNPSGSNAVEKELGTKCCDWILPQAEDTLIIDMLQMDTKNLAEIMLQYDTSELAKKTKVKKIMCPEEGSQTSHQKTLSNIVGLGGKKPRKKRRKKPRAPLCVSLGGKILRDLKRAEQENKDGGESAELARKEKRQRAVTEILAAYRAEYKDLTMPFLKLKIQQDLGSWLRDDLSVSWKL